MRAPTGPATAPGITRRRVLAGLLLVPPALAGCSIGDTPSGPDPLIALADAARSDAALASAAIAASPALADRVQPLVDARTAHATALDAEVARLASTRSPATPAARPASTTGGSPATLAQVHAAVLASARSAATVALDLPAERVGLVASVAACCGAYGEVLA